LFSLLSLVFGLVCHAATHVVLPGQSLQAAINGAASGDTIVIPTAGAFPENITITGKALRIRGAQAGNHDIEGNFVISAVPAGGKVTLRNLTVLGNLDANGSSLDLLRCKVTGETTLPSKLGSTGNEVQLIVVQSELREKLVSKVARSWVGYSTLYRSYFENKVELVGNDFDGRAGGGIGIDLNGTTTTTAIHNNRIHHYSLNAGHGITEECIGIRVAGGANADVINNVIHDCYDGHHVGSETDCGMGVFVKAGAKAVVRANVMWNCLVYGDSDETRGDRLVYAPADSIVRYNILHSDNRVGGGVSDHDNLNNVAPSFVGGGDYHLAPGARGINEGPHLPQYNDRDGTRNNIGMYGGHNFIPDGRTTDKPIPIIFSAAPLSVPVGGVITIESTGATVK
jgi:hypothetical protein